MKVNSSVGIGAVALVVTLGMTTTASAPRSTEEMVERANAILGAVTTLDACPSQCEYLSCTEGEHINYTVTPPQEGSDAGELHMCAISTKGCGDHLCMPGGGALPELASILEQLGAPEIRDIDSAYDKVVLNPGRRAIQVLGCDNKVVLSLSISTEVANELFAATR
jgi:hypothetical protein